MHFQNLFDSWIIFSKRCIVKLLVLKVTENNPYTLFTVMPLFNIYLGSSVLKILEKCFLFLKF